MKCNTFFAIWITNTVKCQYDVVKTDPRLVLNITETGQGTFNRDYVCCSLKCNNTHAFSSPYDCARRVLYPLNNWKTTAEDGFLWKDMIYFLTFYVGSLGSVWRNVFVSTSCPHCLFLLLAKYVFSFEIICTAVKKASG